MEVEVRLALIFTPKLRLRYQPKDNRAITPPRRKTMKLYFTLASAFIATAAAANDQTPALRSLRGGDESGRFSGTVELPEFSTEEEREALLNGAVCTGIERLLGGTVACECTPEILAGSLTFDCDSLRDVTIRQNIIYTPSFNGLFTLSLAQADVSFGVGYCLDGFTVTIDQAPIPINAGDVCFSGRVKLDAFGDNRFLTPSLESCTFSAGNFGVCEACEPCTTVGGRPGFSVTCDFVEVASCVPLLLPISRSSRRVNPQAFGEQVADGMLELVMNDLDRLISEAQAAQAARAQPSQVQQSAEASVAAAVKKVKKDKKPKKDKN